MTDNEQLVIKEIATCKVMIKHAEAEITTHALERDKYQAELKRWEQLLSTLQGGDAGTESPKPVVVRKQRWFFW